MACSIKLMREYRADINCGDYDVRSAQAKTAYEKDDRTWGDKEMKRKLLRAVYGLLLAGTAVVMTPAYAEGLHTDIMRRAIQILSEATERAMAECNTTRIDVTVPTYDYQTKSEKTKNHTITIQWSGGCVDGKRDGDGVLTSIHEVAESGAFRLTKRAEGRFVKGRLLGLWCETRMWESKVEKGASNGCVVLAGLSSRLTKLYQKQPDGSWAETDGNKMLTGVTLAPGTLEAQGARVLADAAAGKTDLKVDVAGQSAVLADLVRGSRISLAPVKGPLALKDKRIAVVLSSGTLNELERFRRERDALLAASSRLTKKAAQERARFLAASNPDRLLVTVAKTVRKHAKTVEAADDLVGLKQGRFDYALIFDWKYSIRFDLLGKFGGFPVGHKNPSQPVDSPLSYAGESGAIFLVGPDLKAVKHGQLPNSGTVKWPSHEEDDVAYLNGLAGFFGVQWGKGPDDVGSLEQNIDFILTF